MADFNLTKNPIEDDELAACLAAVQSILDDEQSAQAQPCNESGSAWQAAMLLESTGRSGQITDRARSASSRNLWKASGLPRLLFILTTIATTGGSVFSAPAQAEKANQYGQRTQSQTAVMAESDLMTDVMPPEAPEFEASSAARSTDRWTGRSGGSMGNSMNRGTGHSFEHASGPPALLRPALPQPEISSNNAPYSTPSNDLSDVLGGSSADLQNGERVHTIRIALSVDTSTTEIVLPDGATLKDASTGDTLAQLPPQSRWQIASRSQGGFAQLSFAGQLTNVASGPVMLAQRPNNYRDVALSPLAAPRGNQLMPLPPQADARFYLPQTAGRSFVLVPPSTEGTIAVGSNLYRGSLMLRPRKGQTFSVINVADLEDYLLSVVPSEMPSSWSLEALKAQAIAARSYAVACIGKHGSEGYDVKQTTDDQVYSGVGSESPISSEAVAETRGMVMRCQGQVITAYFHSASGGYTELSEHVWSKPLPYLKAVPDYDDASPHFSWNKNYSVANIEQLLAKNGKNVGALLALVPVARGASPRVKVLLATGSNGNAYMTGEEARRIFSLPSSCFNVCGASDTYVFAGRGFGHGLGMSQWGAKRLAEAGYNAGQILSYYYKDIAIERF